MIGSKMASLWIQIRNSLWLIPILILLLSVVLAVALVDLSTTLGVEATARWPRVFGAGAEGSRSMLTAIASSMITVAGVVFSITIVTLALASSQYSSRVLRNFMDDRTSQGVLGVFLGIYSYCLIVLRTIRDGPDPFVPVLAVLGGVFLAFVGIAYLVYFIHHIATAIQASNILARVSRETLRSIDRVWPESSAADFDDEVGHANLPEEGGLAVVAAQDGYVQQIDEPGLLRLAREQRGAIWMKRGIGDFVAAGTTLAVLQPDSPSHLSKGVCRSVTIGQQRLLSQDPSYGLRQIVDMALKALSPGINDSTTATMALDYLAAIFTRITRRPLPLAQRHECGQLLISVCVPTYAGLLELAFGEIRRQAEGNVAVLHALLQALELIGDGPIGHARRLALLGQIVASRDAATRSIGWAKERAVLEDRADRMLVRLAVGPSTQN